MRRSCPAAMRARRRSRPSSVPSTRPTTRCTGCSAPRMRSSAGFTARHSRRAPGTRRPLLEEPYEVYDALEAGSTPALADELGDLLLQVVLHAEYAAEAGVFDLSDVYRSIMAKIVRRHPHVFGELEVASVGEVIRNWETIKAGERAEAAAAGGPPGPPRAEAMP